MKRERDYDIDEDYASSLMNGLVEFQRGALLAMVLYKLEKSDLLSMYNTCKRIYVVCHRYQMLERLYTNSVFMFGSKVYGKLGYGDVRDHVVGIPSHIQGIPKVAALSCGSYHTGIVTVEGDVYMFGDGSYGKLGDGNTSDHDVGVPTKIQGIPKVSALSCGANHTGIVTVDGQVYMFGRGSYGKLGDGNTSNHDVGVPQKIQGIPKVSTISCGVYYTGIITVHGAVYAFGKLGDGDTSNHNVGVPKQIQGIPKADTISCGCLHTGILTVDGDVYMFGVGHLGKLGDGDTSEHSVGTPKQIQGIPKVTAISCGNLHTGIVTVDGDVYMFGYGAYGRLGDGDTSEHSVGTPKQIQGIPKISSISCGQVHTGLVTAARNVYMFGNGAYGKLGDGDTNNHKVGVPKHIQGIHTVAGISCGMFHTGIVTIPESSLNFNIN